MANFFHTPEREFKRPPEDSPSNIGGLNKSRKQMNIQRQIDAIEAKFMSIAFKAGRAEDQREARRNKRK